MQRITKMRYAILSGLVVLVALALAGASAVSVNASEHEFYASASGTATSKQTNEQIFTTTMGYVECASASGTGEVTAGTTGTNKEVVTYSSCVGSFGNATISPVHYEFNANGPAKIEKAATITPEGATCHVTIFAQTLNSVTYENKSGKVTAKANVNGIRSKGSGGACGTEEETAGTYSGSLQATLSGGTLEWR